MVAAAAAAASAVVSVLATVAVQLFSILFCIIFVSLCINKAKVRPRPHSYVILYFLFPILFECPMALINKYIDRIEYKSIGK